MEAKTAVDTQTKDYQAPHLRHEENAVPQSYIVIFHPDHNVASHLAFLGRDFRLAPISRGYCADDVDDHLLSAIRRDPGVEYVEDNTSGEWLGEKNDYEAEYLSHGADAVPQSYMLTFYPGHTLAKHFAFLGREFTAQELDQGYFAYDVDDQLLSIIRRDPGVKYVEDNVSGERLG